jgi:hypothetical protein
MAKRTLEFTTGTYTPNQAEELLTNHLHNEMKFHKLQNFTSVIRFEENCEQASNNLQLLQQGKDVIKHLVTQAKQAGMCLQIESKIHITLVEDEGATNERIKTAAAVFA